MLVIIVIVVVMIIVILINNNNEIWHKRKFIWFFINKKVSVQAEKNPLILFFHSDGIKIKLFILPEKNYPFKHCYFFKLRDISKA